VPRPLKPRWIQFDHTAAYYEPVPAPGRFVESFELTFDELEALRLADAEGLRQDEAATWMNISRQTFGRVVASARRKVALALVYGRGLRIQGGRVHQPPPGKRYRGGAGHGGPGHGGRGHGSPGPHGPAGRGPGRGGNGPG
jgi:uncharacterized protein